MSSYKLLIDGQLVDGAATLEVINPAEGKVLAVAPRADVAQLNQAVAAAKKAFPAWSALKPEEREAKLNQLADALEAKLDEFARLLTQEQGKPLPEAQGEVMGAVFGLRAFGAMRAEPKELQLTDTARVIEVRTLATLVPSIFSVARLTSILFAPLATSNTMVLSSSRSNVVFSVTSGRRMTSVSFMITR